MKHSILAITFLSFTVLSMSCSISSTPQTGSGGARAGGSGGSSASSQGGSSSPGSGGTSSTSRASGAAGGNTQTTGRGGATGGDSSSNAGGSSQTGGVPPTGGAGSGGRSTGAGGTTGAGGVTSMGGSAASGGQTGSGGAGGGSSVDAWGGLKNPPVKSEGCGKALGSINKTGTYHIASAGGRGDYIIDIPTGYDKDKPYRLVFGNHCMGGSAARVAAADNGDDLSGFYSIKTLADKDNSPGIYVALQGDGGGTWNAPNDLKFFADVLALVEGNLCIDTTRVFVAGFSFGAMFSYALSLEYPEKIRAVATYAPANWNFYQPTNRHIPIAYYQTTGTGDGTCSWINNDAQKLGGKYCLLQHAQDNGCDATAEIKLATSGTHVTTEFKGCKDGYPVKFSSHNGGHTAVASDPGSNVNWIENETWAFFKQF